MQESALRDCLAQHFQDDECLIGGDDYHRQITIISERFNDLSRVKRQQLVYAALQPHIQTGELHAVSLQTFTPAEWEQHNG